MMKSVLIAIRPQWKDLLQDRHRVGAMLKI